MLRLAVPALASLLWGLAAAALASPTGLNLIPTADVMPRHYLNVQLESDGYPTACSRGSNRYLLTQFGLRDDLELGFDVCDLGGENDFSLDAKWQFCRETPRRPAMAVGVMNVWVPDCETVYYLALSKTVLTPDTRLTLGVQRDGTGRFLVGASHDLGERVALLADFTSGPGGYATLGVSVALTPQWYLQPYYGWNNSSGGEDFMGLNLTWEGSLCCGEE